MSSMSVESFCKESANWSQTDERSEVRDERLDFASKSKKTLSLIFKSAKANLVVPSSFFDDGMSLLMSSSKCIWPA
jgi:hypothetical protein